MKTKRNILEIILGLVFIIVLGLLAMYITSKNENQDPSWSMYVKFKDVGTRIEIGSDVKIAGVTVGQVAELVIEQKTFLAIVKINIFDLRLNIPIDSIAFVKSDNLIGKSHIAISPGISRTALPANGEIKTEGEPFSLEKIIKKGTGQ